MKITLCTYYRDPDEDRDWFMDCFTMVRSIAMLRRRAALLRKAGWEVEVYGQVTDLRPALQHAKLSTGCLWAGLLVPDNRWRMALLETPDLLEEMLFYLDGPLGLSGEVTARRVDALAAMGVQYLENEDQLATATVQSHILADAQ